ncbi:helix-turn-helix transcriptional regulator [Flavobacterium sp. FlaQc-50]|uniref:S24 family peptidase n=1 Tax=unclassified Flavobacterium TaxID=196869 RepID=UPI003756D658
MRLKEYIDFKGFSNSSFEKQNDLSNGYIATQIKRNADLGEGIIKKILDNCLDLDPIWFLTGSGTMLKSVLIQEVHNKDGIPLIDIDAMAGYGSGDNQIMQYDTVSGYRIPELEGKGVKYLIRVSGSSMYPKYSNGDLLACKPLKDRSFFQWGKPYVLDTEQGAIVKRLFQCEDDEECLECHSDNKTHYPPFKIPKNSIRALAIVVGVIRLE